MLPLILLCALPAVWSQSTCMEFPLGRRVFNMEFPFSHWGPAASPLCPNTSPDGRDTIDPVYTMFSRGNPIFGQNFTEASNPPPAFDGSRRTIFVAHGWNNDPGTSPWMTDIRIDLLEEGDYNVVIVDWGGGSHQANYNLAASTTRTAGAWTAEVMANLVNNGAAWSRMHCIGHSLGAHHCGFAGHWVRDHMGGLMDRISGLDPAGPMFQNNDENSRINRFAADYVDIIHTDTQLNGNHDLLGHHDYYPADGQQMPGCGIDIGGSCSHARVFYYYVESILTNCFVSRLVCTGRDDNQIPTGCSAGVNSHMGFHSNKLVPGNQQRINWLDVNANAPFCQG